MALTDKLKLFIIDFDGTALGGYEPYDRFPDNLSDFLDEISTHGVLWATCTTWHPYMQDNVFKASSLTSRPVRLIGRISLNCGLYINGKIYMDAEWDHEMLVKKAHFDKNYVQAIRSFLKSCSKVASVTEYFDYIFSIEYTIDRESIISKLNSDKIIKEYTYFQFSSDEKNLQILPCYLSKGVAVKKLQDQLGISPEFTMVAGDEPNDIPMFQKDIASMQIAPAGADLQVKQRINQNGGIIGNLPYSDGIIEAAGKLLGI